MVRSHCFLTECNNPEVGSCKYGDASCALWAAAAAVAEAASRAEPTDGADGRLVGVPGSGAGRTLSGVIKLGAILGRFGVPGSGAC